MSGRATEAVLTGDDAPLYQRCRIEAADMLWCRMICWYGQGIVKIAIVQRSVPAHVNLRPAHQTVDRFRVERVAQQLEVSFMLASSFEIMLEASDGHVRYRY